jgi:hypothetical protein
VYQPEIFDFALEAVVLQDKAHMSFSLFWVSNIAYTRGFSLSAGAICADTNYYFDKVCNLSVFFI